MVEEPKSGMPRWILIATGVVGLVAAILVAASNYYEFHKARAEAAKVQEAAEAERKAKQEKNKEGAPDSTTGFAVGSVWVGFGDESIGLRNRLEIDQCANGKLKGLWTLFQAGVEWYTVRIQGTVSPDNEVEFRTRTEDLVSSQRKLEPCYFKGLIRGNEFIGRWTADSGSSGPFKLIRQ
jgi:hypothetical protein